MTSLRGQDDAAATELAAVALLRNREHTRLELRRKLLARRYTDMVVDEVLDSLECRGLLSDVRFAELFVDQRSRRGYGPLRIRAELAERGVDNTLISRCLASLDDTWQARLDDVATTRFDARPVADRRELARRGRFLQQRGFPADLVRRYLARVGRG